MFLQFTEFKLILKSLPNLYVEFDLQENYNGDVTPPFAPYPKLESLAMTAIHPTMVNSVVNPMSWRIQPVYVKTTITEIVCFRL